MTEQTVRFYGKADEKQMKNILQSPLQSLKQGFDHGFG